MWLNILNDMEEEAVCLIYKFLRQVGQMKIKQEFLKSFAVTGNLFHWFRDYLSVRTQRVVVEGVTFMMHGMLCFVKVYLASSICTNCMYLLWII